DRPGVALAKAECSRSVGSTRLTRFGETRQRDQGDFWRDVVSLQQRFKLMSPALCRKCPPKSTKHPDGMSRAQPEAFVVTPSARFDSRVPVTRCLSGNASKHGIRERARTSPGSRRECDGL